jgi:hypothetical protein
MTYDRLFEALTPPVDPRDEAYTEACEEIARLRVLIKRAADMLETYPTWSRPAAVKLIQELRKTTDSNHWNA